MAIVFSDSFQKYGLGNTAVMLDGLYSNNDGCSLVEDPQDDVSTTVLQVTGGGGANNYYGIRLPFPVVGDHFGAAFRVYQPLVYSGSNALPILGQWRTAGNVAIATLTTDTTGRIEARAGDYNGTIIGTTTLPALSANAWFHFAVQVDNTAQTLAVWVNGKQVLDLSGLSLSSTAIAQIHLGVRGPSTGGYQPYFKDFLIWDDSGSDSNTYPGQVSVFWRKGVSTISNGGWTSSVGLDAHLSTNKPRWSNTLTSSGAISSGNQVRINSTYYNWTSGSVNAGTPAGTSSNPWLVALGANAEESLANMYAAIGGTGTPGTTYSSSLVAHTTVVPYGLSTTSLSVVPLTDEAQAMTFTETGANTSWASGSAFVQRTVDAANMSAGFIAGDPVTYPTAFEVGLEDLPEDVTSIRAVIPYIRGAKIDGGDGAVVVSFGISEESYDDGPETELTQAFTYWPNSTEPFVSSVNPDTGLRWSPTDFNNGARIKVDRTV